MSEASACSLTVETLGEVRVVRFVGRRVFLNTLNLRSVSEQLFALVDGVTPQTLVIDFGNVEYLFSDVLGQLVALHRRLQTLGGNLILCNFNSQISEILTVTRLNEILDIRRPDEIPGLSKSAETPHSPKAPQVP